MSFMAKVKVQIKDLYLFEKACEKNGASFDQETLCVSLPGMSNHKRLAYLRKEGDVYSLYWDNDARYSPLAEKYGKKGGVLVRDYTALFIKRQAERNGAVVTESKVGVDGSVTLRLARAS